MVRQTAVSQEHWSQRCSAGLGQREEWTILSPRGKGSCNSFFCRYKVSKVVVSPISKLEPQRKFSLVSLFMRPRPGLTSVLWSPRQFLFGSLLETHLILKNMERTSRIGCQMSKLHEKQDVVLTLNICTHMFLMFFTSISRILSCWRNALYLWTVSDFDEVFEVLDGSKEAYLFKVRWSGLGQRLLLLQCETRTPVIYLGVRREDSNFA